MRIESYLQRIAHSSPNKTALVCGLQRWSYAQLDELCDRLARGLVAGGVRRGDRVAIFLPNGLEAVAAIFAVLKAGAAFVMINPTTKADKLAFVLNNSRATAVLLPEQKLDMLRSLGDELPHLQLAVLVGRHGKTSQDKTPQNAPQETDLDANDITIGGIRCATFDRLVGDASETILYPTSGGEAVGDGAYKTCNDLAAIVYTSGSSGRPKGVMLTHDNVTAAIDAIAAYLQNTADDVILNVLSLSFGYGLTQLFTAVKVGATLVLEESFTYPHAVMKRFEEEGVTGFAMVPTIAAILLQMDLSKYNLRRLRYMTNAGAALPKKHITALRNVLPDAQLFLMYGQTECLRVSYLPPHMIDERPESVGRGMPGVEAYIVDPQGCRLPADEVGELVVRGDNVMQGYWELPQETERALRRDEQGRRVLYTGDLFRADDEGYLYFVARGDDIIKTRGEKVSPREVENVLYSHPDVVEAVVYGAADDILGEAVHAAVVVRKGCRLAERELLFYCSRHLEDFMVPQAVTFHDSLPKTPNGKINKQELMGATLS